LSGRDAPFDVYAARDSKSTEELFRNEKRSQAIGLRMVHLKMKTYQNRQHAPNKTL
jgi:hypothetical protein